MRSVLVFGSTGSIGKSTLAVIREHPGRFRVAGLAAHQRAADIVSQWREFRPPAIALVDRAAADEARRALHGEPVEVREGEEGLVSLLDSPGCDTVLAGIAGAAGLASTFEAVRRGKRVAIANKESLVMAGPLLLAEARRSGAEILPVDSEHCAVAQAMLAGRREEVRRVLLTASGGALRDRPLESLRDATAMDALRHPTWKMGVRITIDSATLMNKALEVVEAVHLFGLPPERVEVVLHAQSIVHSMVEFRDGSVIAQLGRPDMRLPILWALAHPERPEVPGFRLEVSDLARLDFAAPDPRRYPALALGYAAAGAGGTAGAVLNAADERAVEAFVGGGIRFTDVARLVGEVLAEHRVVPDPTIEQALAADREARAAVDRRVAR